MCFFFSLSSLRPDVRSKEQTSLFCLLASISLRITWAAPNLHIARKVSNGRFAIAGGQSGLEVSWQVTGVRKDALARANPLEVEKEKPLNEQGF